MLFESAALNRILADWTRAPSVDERACAHNVSFDERTSAVRRARLEARCAGTVFTTNDLHDRLIDNFRESVLFAEDVPETFEAANDAAVIAGLSPEITLVRLESIKQPLQKLAGDAGKIIETFNKLRDALDSRERAARSLVQKVMDVWEDPEIVRYRNPVCFAALRSHLLSELAAPNWAEQLRDRLGLAHYDPALAGPVPVALMQYEVADVLDAVRDEGRFRHHFAAPTALDTEPYSAFFPTPREMPSGCPMALSVIGSEDDLIAEILHPRITYKREHLARVFLFDSSPAADDLMERRNLHLLALKLAANRDDFGEDL